MKLQRCDGESAPQKHRGLREPWKPGESGNPAGRPKGSRNKLGEEFITEVLRRADRRRGFGLFMFRPVPRLAGR